MHIYICMYVCVSMNIWQYVYMYACWHLLYLYVYTSICLYVHISIFYMSVYRYVCPYIYTSIHLYICISIYLYIWRPRVSAPNQRLHISNTCLEVPYESLDRQTYAYIDVCVYIYIWRTYRPIVMPSCVQNLWICRYVCIDRFIFGYTFICIDI